MITIALQLRFLSPAFLGGAGPDAELRPATLKGMLRFWYRAIDPRFERERESALFGGAGAGRGQSPLLLRVASSERWQPIAWNEPEYRRRFTRGQGRQSKNGLVYLGFPFQLRGNEEREALPAGLRFTLHAVILRPPRERRDQQALVAALWWLATLGALGMRSRRGFGSLALESWDCNDKRWQDEYLGALPILDGARDAQAWMNGFSAALDSTEDWLGSWEDEPGRGDPLVHPHLGPKLRCKLVPPVHRTWEDALNAAGRQLQDFRQRRQPDYGNVKAHLQSLRGEGGQRLKAAPERAVFGLPLTFRFGSLRGQNSATTFVPWEPRAAQTTPPERHASPVLLKLVTLRDGLYPLWLALDGPRPGVNPRAGERKAPRPLQAAPSALIEDFFSSLGRSGAP